MVDSLDLPRNDPIRILQGGGGGGGGEAGAGGLEPDLYRFFQDRLSWSHWGRYSVRFSTDKENN